MYDYSYLNQIFSETPIPAEMRNKDNYAFRFFRKILFEKALSVFEFENFPETWDRNFFETCLFGQGFLTVIYVPAFGFIPQPCTFSEYNIFYQPRKVLVASPYLPESAQREYLIGVNCVLLRLRPNLESIMPVVDYYASKLAGISQSIDVNVFNSKTPNVFEVENKNEAATLRKAYDKASSGEPLVIVHKASVKGASQSVISDSFTGKNYISDKLHDLYTKFENEFNSRVGIPGVDVEKKERLISSEVEAATADNSALAKVMERAIKDGLDQINKFAGTNITVKNAYEVPAQTDKEEPKDDK